MKLENIESIYPLSPMQESMLFYAQSRVQAKQLSSFEDDLQNDVLFNQANISLSGELNTETFRQAWQIIVDENSALRTGFLWEGLQQAQQFVRKTVELPFEFIDLSNVEKGQRQEDLLTVMAKDRQQGFELSIAPLMRVKLIKLDRAQYQLIWSSHHLVLDRWCIALVFERLVDCYDALQDSIEVPKIERRYFKTYIAWRQKYQRQKSEAFWRGYLQGLAKTSLLCSASYHSPASEHQHSIKPAALVKLKQFCRQHKITLASAFQSIWALAINHAYHTQDLVFGVVVSGRPSQIKDVEFILGSFVNTVPVRVSLPKHLALLDYFRVNQDQAYKRFEFEHEASSVLQDYCNIPSTEVLFDHVLVWQNAAPLKNSRFFKLEPQKGRLSTAYPLTISIEEGASGLIISSKVQANWQFSQQALVFSVLDSIIEFISSGDLNSHSDISLSQLPSFVFEDQSAINQHDIVRDDRQDKIEHKHSIDFARQVKVADKDLVNKVVKGRTKLSEEVLVEFLMREWKTLLKVDDLSIDDDFFALGGSSIKAAQLVASLEKIEQKHIPIIRLFSARTIRSMKELYLNTDWSIKSQWTTVLNHKGKGNPIFFIASPEVNTIGYAQLSRELGSDVSACVVQPPPSSEYIRQIRNSEIPSLSQDYIKEIKKIQKDGPYIIVGMCSGAQISAEIVRQLEKDSIQISFFGIINTWARYTISPLYHLEKLVDFYRMLRYYAKRLASLRWHEVKLRLIPAIKKGLGINKAKDAQSSDAQEFIAPIRQYDNTYVPIEEEKWAREKPESILQIRSKLTVFRIKDKPYWRVNSASLGWDFFAENVDIVYLQEKQHEAILREPHIADFAKQIKTAIALRDAQDF